MLVVQLLELIKDADFLGGPPLPAPHQPRDEHDQDDHDVGGDREGRGDQGGCVAVGDGQRAAELGLGQRAEDGADDQWCDRVAVLAQEVADDAQDQQQVTSKTDPLML